MSESKNTKNKYFKHVAVAVIIFIVGAILLGVFQKDYDAYNNTLKAKNMIGDSLGNLGGSIGSSVNSAYDTLLNQYQGGYIGFIVGIVVLVLGLAAAGFFGYKFYVFHKKGAQTTNTTNATTNVTNDPATTQGPF